jgi:arylsulfatase A-like enzyme
LSLSYPWAEASAPFKYTKGYTTEGGIRAPFIAAGPMVRDDSVNSAYFTVMDLAPTFLALAGTTYPQNQKHPLLGTSLVPMFSGETASAHADDYVTVLDHNNRALVRQGNWWHRKILMPKMALPCTT